MRYANRWEGRRPRRKGWCSERMAMRPCFIKKIDFLESGGLRLPDFFDWDLEGIVPSIFSVKEELP